MVKKAWSDNKFEGIALRRIFKKLAKKIDAETDLDKMLNIARTMGYIALAKHQLAKSDLEERVSKLEEIAGLAQKSTISR